ncbi:hypothetical protein DW146_19165, partial [Phocaeicola vulgatus]
MFFKSTRRFFLFLMEEAAVFLWYGLLGRLSSSHRIYVFSLMSMWLPSDKFTVSLRWVSFITVSIRPRACFFPLFSFLPLW